MNNPIIYADFNGILPSSQNENRSAIPLDTYGSLKDLTNRQIRLKIGMPLTIYMDSAPGEDLEVESTVYYDLEHKQWLAEFDYEKIRYVQSHADLWTRKDFLCFHCRQDLEPFFREHPRNFETTCTHCGLSILHVLSAPE